MAFRVSTCVARISCHHILHNIKNMLADKKNKKAGIDPQTAIIYHQLEDKIKSIIGTKVQINAKSNKKGRIEIEYYSEEDLERIVSLLETIK